jgi:hypothetical protein
MQGSTSFSRSLLLLLTYYTHYKRLAPLHNGLVSKLRTDLEGYILQGTTSDEDGPLTQSCRESPCELPVAFLK